MTTATHSRQCTSTQNLDHQHIIIKIINTNTSNKQSYHNISFVKQRSMKKSSWIGLNKCLTNFIQMYHPTPPEVVFLPVLFQKLLNEGNPQWLAMADISDKHYSLIVDLKQVSILLRKGNHLSASALEIQYANNYQETVNVREWILITSTKR